MTHRWLPALISLLIICGALVTQTMVPSAPTDNSWLARVNALWYDFRFQLLPPQRAATVPIVIVDLDELTLQREGRWPWNRAKVADLVAALRAQGAALIGFDVVFSEPGGNAMEEVLGVLTQSASSAEKKAVDQWISKLEQLSPQFDGDALFAQQLDSDTVLGFFLHNDGGNAGKLPPAPILIQDNKPQPALLTMQNYTANLEELTAFAAASGLVVALPDGDGIVRRMPLMMRHEDGIYNALSLEMVRIALGAPWVRMQLDSSQSDRPILTGIQIGQQLQVPVDEQGQVLVPYRGRAGAFPTLSATQVLRGDAPEQELAGLKGAIVLIGTSALGLADLRTTPLQTAYPGVEVHANLIDTMLYAYVQQSDPGSIADQQSPFYLTPDWSAGAVAVQIVLFAVLLMLLLPRRSPRTVILISLASVGLLIAFNLGLWQFWHWALPVALPLLSTLLVAATYGIFGYFSITRQKAQIQSLFGAYVPTQHVELMLSQPEAVSLAGEQKEMTVLFADIRNFTAISESLSPTELKSVLNRYLSAITEVIFNHQGTIDKYVGDMVMAFWNAPLDDPEHAQHGVQAALAMQRRARALRAEFAQEGLPQFHIGIGLNTGFMNVGDMGSVYRRAYTVLGDAVNLAARLESLTSFYQVPILVSDSTRAQTQDIPYRTIDRVRVKGRKAALLISEPLDCPGNGKVSQSQLQSYEQAFDAYQAGRWDEAKARFEQLSASHPEEYLYQLYVQRLVHPPQCGPGAVHIHDSK